MKEKLEKYLSEQGSDNKKFKTNDLSFASTETKFKNPITKTQNNFLVNTGFLVKLFQKKPKW